MKSARSNRGLALSPIQVKEVLYVVLRLANRVNELEVMLNACEKALESYMAEEDSRSEEEE